MTTGRADLNESLMGGIGETTFICPSLAGGRNWPGTAIDPDAGVFFVGFNNTCMDYTLKDVSPGAGAYHDSASLRLRHPPNSDGNVSAVMAIEIATGRQAVASRRARVLAQWGRRHRRRPSVSR